MSSGEDTKPDLDEATLIQLKSAGSNLSKPHSLDFFLYFPDQSTADSAAARIRKLGFAVKVEKSTTGTEWLCYSTRIMVPDLHELQMIRIDFNQLAAPLRGNYDGWGTEVER